MIRYILVLVIFVTLASCCCYPHQFHAHVGFMTNYKYGSKNAQHTATAMQIWYDHCNNRAVYKYPKFASTYIYNYHMGEYVYIRNGSCHAYTLRGNLSKMCTPKHHINLGTYNFGAGKLPFHVSGHFSNYQTQKYGQVNVYSADCLPIGGGGYSKTAHGYTVHGSMWVNITLGIKDLSIFEKPEHCKGFTRGIVHQDLDLLDVISRSSEKDVSVTKGEKFIDTLGSIFGGI